MTTPKEVKPGSLVIINKSESIIDGATLKIIGWYEDKLNHDVNVELFDITPIGVYLGLWTSEQARHNASFWHEILVGSKVYLFRFEQLQPICQHTSTPEDNSLILLS